ncbi:MAG: DUF4976 domain-containing protein [Acidobacteria bacterium]|nr:MAG: DUF4976 domain-containing protein [Acidobacteriota bacterium]REK03604.1 MAG: DUF4976 domain-containing protein [Acidobacteriota bacterium]
MPAATERVNLVFLFADDWRVDLPPVLATHTPHIEALRAAGHDFANAFVSTPVCPASRASVLTGLYESSHRFTFQTPPLDLRLLEHSVPRLLRRHGLVTGMIGKDGAALDGPRAELLFDEFRPVSRHPSIVQEYVPGLGPQHAVDHIGDLAVDFIERRAAEDFALFVWFHSPHAQDEDPLQFIPPDRHAGLFAETTFVPPPTWEPSFFAAQPWFLRQSLNRERFWWRWTEELYEPMMRRYLQMIVGLDDAVGRIVEAVSRAGIAGRTVVVLSSDNGFFVGERGFAGKWLGYEPSLRVPLVVFDPRRGAGVVPETVLNLDLAPTFLELAGVPVPARMQGRSLVPLLERGVAPALSHGPAWRDDFFFEHSFAGVKTPIPRHYGVRSDTGFKLIRYRDHGQDELYHWAADPYESIDLVDDPAYSQLLAMLRQRAEALRLEAQGLLFADGFEDGTLTDWSSTALGTDR